MWTQRVPETDEEVREWEAGLQSIIDEQGFAVTGDGCVGARCHCHASGIVNHKMMSFFYTVGLTPMGLPELLALGRVTTDQCLEYLVIPARLSIARGQPLDHGEVIDCLGTPVKVRHVAHHSKWKAHRAHMLYGTDAVSTIQMLWPDPQGLYPDEPGYNLGDWLQPLIPPRRTFIILD